MKKILTLLLMICVGLTTYAATKTSNGTGGGTWSTGSSWVGGSAPAAGDDVIIAAGDLITVSGSSITRNTGTTLTVNGTLRNQNGITLSGTASMIVSSSGTYEHAINGGTIPTATWQSGSTCNITGIQGSTPSGLSQSFHHVIWNCTSQSSSIGLAGNLKTINGDLTITSTSSTTSRDLRFASTQTATIQIGGNLIINGGRLAFSSSTATVTVNVAGNVTVSSGGLYFQDGNIGTGADTLNVAGGLTINGGTLDYTFSGATTIKSVLNLGGTFDISSGTLTKSTAAAGTIEFNFTKSGSQNFTKSGGTISSNTTGPLSFNVKSGTTLNMGNNVLDGTGPTFVLNSGAGIITSNTSGLSSSGATGSIQTTGTRTYNSGANYEFNGAGASLGNFSTVTTPTANQVNNLTISNTTGTISASANIAVAGTLNLGSNAVFNMGTFQLNDGGSFNQTGSGTLRTQKTATAIPSGKTWAGTIQYDATGTQDVIAGVYSYLTITNTGTKTATGALTVNNALGLASGNTLFMSSYQLTDGSNFSQSGTGTIRTQSTATTPIPSGKTWPGTVQYEATTAQNVVTGTYPNLVISGSSTKTATGNITVSTVDIASSDVLNMGTNNLISSGSFAQTGTGMVRTQATSAGLPTGITWAGTVQYDAAGAQTVVDGSYNQLNIANSGTKAVASAITISNTLDIASAATLNLGTYLISVGSGFAQTNTGVLRTQNTSSMPLPSGKTWAGTIQYDAAADQIIVAGTYNNVNITGGGVKTIAADLSVTGTLSTSSASDYVSLDGHTLTVAHVSGPGFVKGSAASSLVVNGSAASTVNFSQTGSDAYLHTLTAAATGGITLNGHLSIVSKLNPSAGTLTIADSLTMKSTSITNTALVGQAGGAAAVTGLVIAERFMPSGKRALRDIATGVVSTRNFFRTWQEGGVNNNGFGTHITGKKGTVGAIDAATGLDMTVSGNPSLYTFNISNTSGASSWDTIKSTNQSADIPSVLKGYRISIRGNRAHNLGVDIATMTSDAILRSRGALVVGNLTYTTTGVSGAITSSTVRLNSASATGFTMIGNPYIAPIDWESIQAASSNIDPAYWVWDPTVGTTGRYVTYTALTGDVSDATSDVNRYIQPGQAFFIRNTSLSPQLKISESDKAASSSNLTQVFRTAGSGSSYAKIRFNLYKLSATDTTNMDGCLVVFGSSFDKAATSQDAGKISNLTENLSLVTGGKTMSIETRPEPVVTDTLNLRVWTMTTGTAYRLLVDMSQFTTAAVQPYLKDAFTNTTTLLNKGTMNLYPFTVTSSTASYNDRFRIVFTATTLPVKFVQVQAAAREGKAMVSWVANESEARDYTVEHSSNNRDFTAIATVAAKGNGNNLAYAYTHDHPAATNWYRIKAVDLQGAVAYSNTVQVHFSSKPALSVYPNPVQSGLLQFTTAGLTAGTYELVLYNQAGQLVYSTRLPLVSGSNSISLPPMAAGSYRLLVLNTSQNIRLQQSVRFE